MPVMAFGEATSPLTTPELNDGFALYSYSYCVAFATVFQVVVLTMIATVVVDLTLQLIRRNR